MSERSAKWLKKRSFLDQREAEVKSELAEASDTLETGVKKVAMATAAVGAALATGYILYRIFKPKKKRPLPQEDLHVVRRPETVRATPKSGLKHMLMERLALMLVQIISTQITLFLSKNKMDDRGKF